MPKSSRSPSSQPHVPPMPTSRNSLLHDPPPLHVPSSHHPQVYKLASHSPSISPQIRLCNSDLPRIHIASLPHHRVPGIPSSIHHRIHVPHPSIHPPIFHRTSHLQPPSTRSIHASNSPTTTVAISIPRPTLDGSNADDGSGLRRLRSRLTVAVSDDFTGPHTRCYQLVWVIYTIHRG
jgi:hypothetical protein